MPFTLSLYVMPLKFTEFWSLIKNRKVSSLAQIKQPFKGMMGFNKTTDKLKPDPNMYEVYKWKLGFDSYRDSLPQFYNDYINSYLKFLQMN